MKAFRVFAIGGFLSYRALFNWQNPFLFVIILLVPSVTQIFFFAYLGRTAGVADDAFYVVGNAIVAAAVPCLFGMSHTIADERYSQTLSTLVVSPASRVALFLGRALPVTANGVVVAAFAFAVGMFALGIDVAWARLPAFAVTVLVAAFACTGLGFVNAALGLRWRETGVLSNLLLYFLLLFAGVNVPLDRMPGWLQTVAEGLPITHAVEAGRRVIAGEGLGDVAGLIGAELLVGGTYLAIGLAMLRLFEVEARRRASLDYA